MEMELTTLEMMAAVSEGVRQAFTSVMDGDGRFDIPHELLYDAIRQGVRDAVQRMATDALTGEVSLDLHAAIRAGTADAVERLARDGPGEE
jgi:hypothetical protein